MYVFNMEPESTRERRTAIGDSGSTQIGEDEARHWVA